MLHSYGEEYLGRSICLIAKWSTDFKAKQYTNTYVNKCQNHVTDCTSIFLFLPILARALFEHLLRKCSTSHMNHCKAYIFIGQYGRTR
jgi:hypothetical protein